tara:strand:- start:355 stop:729 length:375 start_codon:yes stop_codon:yes gene_type:complete
MSWEDILKREVGPTGEFVPRYFALGPEKEPEYQVIEYYVDKSGNRKELHTEHLHERPSIEDVKNSNYWKTSVEDFYVEYDDAGPDTWEIKGLGFDIKQVGKVIDSFYLPTKDLVEEAERLNVVG